jgi:hypothetical protein
MRTATIVRIQPFFGTPAERHDLYIRILALEHFAGLNRCGGRLYERTWAGHRHSRSLGEFRQLAADVERRGIGEPLELCNNRALGDGWHRLACALHLGIQEVPVVVSPRDWVPYDRSLAWLRSRYPEDEAALILGARRRILERIHEFDFHRSPPVL